MVVGNAYETGINSVYFNMRALKDTNDKLTSVSNLIDQAAIAEKLYVSNPTTPAGNTQLWYIAIIGIVIIIVVASVIIGRRKPRAS